jgi:pimeloyl-ACP methyl ester carboxylesterase
MSAIFEYWLLYHPFVNSKTDEELENAEDFSLSVHLNGKIIKSNSEEAPILLFCSGRKGPAMSRAALFTKMRENFEVVCFDYSGFDRPPKGTASVITTRKSMQRDIEAVLKFTQERYPGRPIVVYGEGIGGAVILHALSLLMPEIELLVFDRTYSEGWIQFRRAAFPFLGCGRVIYAMRGRARRWDPLAQLDDIINDGKMVEFPSALFIFPEKDQHLYDGLYHLWRGKKSRIPEYSTEVLLEAFTARHEKDEVNIYP